MMFYGLFGNVYTIVPTQRTFHPKIKINSEQIDNIRKIYNMYDNKVHMNKL